MGLVKWFIKHGPGSIGAIAKAVCNNFNFYRYSNPLAPKDVILLMTLKKRCLFIK
jgi:hypothetical protein